MFAFIALDFITGLFKALATQTFTSSKMRTGLFRKVGLILCVILGVLVDFAQGYLDLGITVPVSAAICAYICIMEISSILENVCAINPNLLPGRLTALFGGTTGGKNNAEDGQNGGTGNGNSSTGA